MPTKSPSQIWNCIMSNTLLSELKHKLIPFTKYVNQPDPKMRQFTNLPKTDKMDAKLYCLTVASNTTLVFKNFPMNKGTENTLALGTRISRTWETPVKLQIPSALLETPLIRNIWRISPQQLSWLEEWKPNISNRLYMEWNTAKHINTNSHGLWHFGIHVSRGHPTASARKDTPVTCSAITQTLSASLPQP